MKKSTLLFLYPLFLACVWGAPPSLLPPNTDMLPERVMNFSCGMEDHLSPFLTPCAKLIVNFHLNTRGALITRNGYTANGIISTYPVTGGGYHTAQTGTSFFAVIVGTGIYKTTNSFGGTYTDVTNGLTLTSDSTNLSQSASLNDFRVFCNELDAPLKLSATVNAAVLGGGPPQIAKTVAQFYNYLFFGNTKEAGTTYPSRLRWSDLNTVDTWPANNYIDIEPNDGDSIICIVAVWRQLLIFKKRSIYQATITGDSGANAFIIRPIARNIGCWAKNSVKVVADHGVFFQGADGVYQLSGFDYFGLPRIKQISDPIYNEFLRINHANFSQSVGGIFRKYNQYWLSYSISTSTVNNSILVYDYVLGETNDFKAWTTYSGINASMLASAEDNSANEIMLSGDTKGFIYKQDVGASDAPLNVKTAISFTYTSQDLPLASPELNKAIKYIYTFTTTDIATTTLTVNLAYDVNTYYTDSFAFTIGTSGALWGTALWGTALWPGGGLQIKRFDVNRSGAKIYRIQCTGNNRKTTQVSFLGYALIYKPENWSE